MNFRERAALDRYITGNWGEDQFKGEDEEMPEPHLEVAKLQSEIDELAHVVYRFDKATFQDVLKLSRRISEVINERLQEIRNRSERPAEH